MYTLIELAANKLGGFRQLHEKLVINGVKSTKNGLHVAVMRKSDTMKINRKLLAVIIDIIGRKEFDNWLKEK
jgi:hypothetical protein